MATAPSDSRCGVGHCTSSRRRARSPAASRRGPRARPSRRRSRCGTSTRRRTARRCARRTARRPARRPRRGTRTSAPSRARAAGSRRVTKLRLIHPPGRLGSPQRAITSREPLVLLDRVPSGAAAQRAADPQPVERDDRPRVGREPHDVAPTGGHREQPGAVGGEQRARFEVPADADDAIGVGGPGARAGATVSAAVRRGGSWPESAIPWTRFAVRSGGESLLTRSGQ